jgi:hypothetical protein
MDHCLQTLSLIDMTVSYIPAAEGFTGESLGFTFKLARGNLRGNITWALYPIGWVRIYRVIIRWKFKA